MQVARLLDAGADPNDGQSLYNALENLDCTRLLLQAGARVAGSNALYRALDLADPAALGLLLAHGGDANEPSGEGPTRDWGTPLLRAIGLRCPLDHVALLLAAGADPSARTQAGIGASRLSQLVGRPDLTEALRAAGAWEPLAAGDLFAAACARADEQAAQQLPAEPPPDLARLLPDTVAWGPDDAARVMVANGWPIEAVGGDWRASALNHAVFRGNGALAAFLLAHGASWQARHGYDDDALGTLSWASVNRPPLRAHGDGDWVGCALALRAHGVPAGLPDGPDFARVRIGGRLARFSAEVAGALA